MLTYANHLGLYAEEIGPCGEALGNFPQAFAAGGVGGVSEISISCLEGRLGSRSVGYTDEFGNQARTVKALYLNKKCGRQSLLGGPHSTRARRSISLATFSKNLSKRLFQCRRAVRAASWALW
jgi:hypothetical protein